MDTLPQDVIRCIFVELKPKDLAAARLVCRDSSRVADRILGAFPGLVQSRGLHVFPDATLHAMGFVQWTQSVMIVCSLKDGRRLSIESVENMPLPSWTGIALKNAALRDARLCALPHHKTTQFNMRAVYVTGSERRFHPRVRLDFGSGGVMCSLTFGAEIYLPVHIVRATLQKRVQLLWTRVDLRCDHGL